MSVVINSPSSWPPFNLPVAQQARQPAPVAQLDEGLKHRARNNDAFIIDYLFTLACENSPLATAAESFLFDLYTGKEGEASQPLRIQLGKDSLKLYEIVQARNEKCTDDRWEIPAKMLIMAGFETESLSNLREDIVADIRQQLPQQLSNVIGHEDYPINSAIFDNNRYITSAELDSISAVLNHKQSRVTFHDAIGIPEAGADRDALTTRMAANFSHHNQPGFAVDFKPLLFREHWVLFGTFTANDGQRMSIVFDSLACLNPDEKAYLERLASDSSPLFLQANLQDNAPNACGLLVAKAMQAIADNPGEPEQALQKFIDKFRALDNSEQLRFNTHGRAELYGVLLDNLSQFDR
ncbi:hypothetical protein N5923_09740 [Erwiniaceae bacterium BAC15a-03b]|uniref:Deubiquitinase SseL n=1 Tax=Winslowiella arboricola TaxID=2978220 RepID=A0A9J6PQ10_9GAMM|nr:hypothetical protein [Winslowiella arboricola]MCU5773863.1 hypothetical protein [Winslowiella arboricola]MCU5777773.1 hypothetical protein [Winslowiella arboricola]